MYFLDSDDDEDGMGLEDYSCQGYLDYISDTYDEYGDFYSNLDMSDEDYHDEDYEETVSIHPSEEEMSQLKRMSTMFASMNKDRKANLFCDAIILVGMEKFPVHKLILKAASSYFSAMFTGSFTEGSEKVVEIQGVAPNVFRDILEYMYGGEFKLTLENVKDIFVAADMLCIDDLIGDCKLFIKKNWMMTSDISVVFEITKQFELTDITEDIVLQAQRDLGRLLVKGDYCELSYDFILTVLEARTEDNQLTTEAVMLERILNWVLFNPKERLPENAPVLLSFIRFEFILETSFNFIQKELIASHSEKMNKEELESFVKYFEDLYSKARSKISEQNVEIVVPDVSTNLQVSIFSCKSFKWENKSFTYEERPQSYVLDDEEMYAFNAKGGQKINLCSEVVTKLPDFPDRRHHSTFCVTSNTLYVAGGVKENQARLGEILDLRSGQVAWHRGITWFKNKCFSSSISHNHTIYIVGGSLVNKNKDKDKAECFAYNTLTKYFQRICELSFPACHANLAIHDGILYVFANSRKFPEQIDLAQRKRIPIPRDIDDSESKGFPVLSVCSVSSGILIAYLYTDKILLAIFKPSEKWEIQLLGFIPEPFTSFLLKLLLEKPRVLMKNKPLD